MTQVATVPGGTPKWYYLVSTNDSDVTITVPTGKMWEVFTVHCEISTTATAGNRILQMLVQNTTPATVASYSATDAIVASKTGVYELKNTIGAYNTTAGSFPLLSGTTADIAKCGPIFKLILPAGYSMRIYDKTAVDPAADDMIISIQYIEYDA